MLLKTMVNSRDTIFLTESETISNPTIRIRNETIIEAMYSIRACPNG